MIKPLTRKIHPLNYGSQGLKEQKLKFLEVDSVQCKVGKSVRSHLWGATESVCLIFSLLTDCTTSCCRVNWTHWTWPLWFELWTWTETSSLHQTDLEFCTTSWLVGSWALHTLLTICPLMTGISFKRCCFSPGFCVVSGHPATYADYFSLNKTTAELRVLQPINRDLYQRFTLIIKVIIFGFPFFWVYCGVIQRQPFFSWLED